MSLNAAVSPSSATGRVTFYDGVTMLGTKPLVSGAASFTSILLPAGTRKLTSYYSGDATHAAAGSNSIIQTVNAQPGGGLLTGPSSGTAPGVILLVSDFNGDGKADLLSNSNGTTVLLGDGAGNFQPSFTQSAAAFGAATGDLNGDGIPDLVLSVGTGSSFSDSILLGKGDGTFQTVGSLPAGTFSTSLAIADFNGDGKADLVSVNPQAVNILLGNGDGTFQPQVTIPGGIGANLVLIGDFNGDGKADIVAVNGPLFTVLTGNGDGTFRSQTPVSLPPQDVILSLSASDFNGDGHLDLVTSSGEVLLGKGDGTFQAAVNYAPGLGPTAQVAVGDFNGDGKTDLIFTNNALFGGGNRNQILLAIGNGDGTFQSPVAVAVPNLVNLGSPIVGDFNGDGVADVAVSSQGASVSTFFGTTKNIRPTLGNNQSATVTTAFATPLQVTVKDGNTPLNGVTVTFSAPDGTSFNPSALLSSTTAITNANGVASVTATANGNAGQYAVSATAAGVTTAFVLTNAATIPANIRQSPATPQSTLVGTPFPSPLSVTVTDSAGVPVSGLAIEFVAPVNGPSASFSGTSVWQVTTDSNGVATVSAIANYIPGNYTISAFAPNSTANLPSVSFSMTNLAPTPIPVTLTTSPNPSILGSSVTMTATVSRTSPTARVTFYDGTTPLGSASASSGVASFTTTLLPAGTHTVKALYRDDPNVFGGLSNPVTQIVNARPGGSFLTQSAANLPPAGSSVVMGDFNRDGKVDFAYLSGSASVSVILGKGDGTFQAPVVYTVGVAPATTLLVADFDGDGNLDIAATSANVTIPNIAPGPSILYGKGDGTFRPSSDTSQALAGGAAVADLNGDGRPDIVIANLAHNTTLLGGISESVGAQPRISVPGPDWVESMRVLTNNGDGTFRQYFLAQVPGILPAGLSYRPTLLVADFNGDGNPDLLASPDGSSVSRYLVLMNGDLTMKSLTPMTIQGLSSVSAILTGDFNGDGIIDLAVGGRSASNTATTVILFGYGDGTFQSPVSYPLGSAALAGDFNGDGFIDLVLTDGNGNTSGILQGSANGTFTAVAGASGGAPLAVADLNGDGREDILTSTVVLLGTSGASGGGTPASIAATGGTPQSTVASTNFATPLQATVRDAAGVPVVGAIVTFSAPASGASATLSSNTVTTNASGVASVTAQANGITGSYVVTASVGSFTANFSLTNTAGNGNTDLAVGKPATQSSTLSGVGSAVAGSAVDGNTDGSFFNGSVSATNADTNAWWQVDLGASPTVTSVVVWNRTDCCGSRLSDFWVFVSDTPFATSDTPATLQNRAGLFASHQTSAPSPSVMVPVNASGRYVRVQLSGTDYLSLAEVQVFGTFSGPGSADVAQGKAATQSSTLGGYPNAAASSAVDGSTAGNFFTNTVTATDADMNAWWQVDLGASTAVNTVVIWNRTDCCGSRLSDYWVFISDTPFLSTDTPTTLQNRPATYANHQTSAPTPSTTITANAQGRYVRIQLSGTDYLSLAEVQVFAINSGPAPTLLSQGKPATESSTLPGSPTAGVAVDGNTDGNFFDGSVTATNAEANAWWQVDLGASASVSSVLIFNRTDCCSSRLSDYWVFISDTPFLASDTPATLQNRAGTYANHQTSAAPAIIATNGAQGRYVRVQLTGSDYLSLAEVQVMGTFLGTPATNLAAGKAASQSSTLLSSPSAGVAVDGNTDGNYFHRSVTATNPDANAWWQVDLGTSASIGSVAIFNRTDCCGSRLGDYWVFISDTPFQATDTPATLQNRAGTFASHQTSAPNPSATIQTTGAHGRYVRVQLSGTDYLSLAEVQVFGQ